MTEPITKSKATPNRHGSVLDALREEFGFEKRFLRCSLTRSILLFALLPLVWETVEPWDLLTIPGMILWGAPIALLILLGWSDEFVPL